MSEQRARPKDILHFSKAIIIWEDQLEEIMKLFYLILIVLFQDIVAWSAPCLVDQQICRKRSAFIYQLDRELDATTAACGKALALKVDWNSFAEQIGGNDTYGADGCIQPLKFLKELCETDKQGAKKVVDSIHGVHCQGAAKDKNSLSIKGKYINFFFDPTNDYRSDRPGPATSEFVTSEMKALFKISVANSRDKENAENETRKQKQAKDDKDREDKRAIDQKKREADQKKIQDDVAAQVKAANEKAQKKAEKYQGETKKLTTWLQDQIKTIQNSKDSPEVKSQKMQSVSEKYRLDLEKATKEYSEDK